MSLEYIPVVGSIIMASEPTADSRERICVALMDPKCSLMTSHIQVTCVKLQSDEFGEQMHSSINAISISLIPLRGCIVVAY